MKRLPRALPPKAARIGVALLFSAAAWPSAFAESSRRWTCDLALTATRYNFHAEDGNGLRGAGATLGMGLGYVGETWFARGTFDILLGPYGTATAKSADYFGTGFTAWTGLSAQTKSLRTSEGSYGFALGLNYADILGTSVGQAGSETTSPPSFAGGASEVANFGMHVTSLSVLPALFFSWLKEPRPSGNSPELLMTRIEGYLLTLGVNVPIQATYVLHYDQLGATKHSVDQHGPLGGYSAFLSFATLLGV